MTTAESAAIDRSTLEHFRSAHRWVVPTGVTAFVIAVGALYWPTVHSLLVEWLDADKRVYTHGLLIAALCLWLLIRANADARLIEFNASGTVVSAFALASLGFLWLVMFRSGIQVGHQALFPIVVLVAVCVAFGTNIAGRCLTPLLLLYFAIPVWDAGVGLLQALTVGVVGAALKIVGVPAHVSGNFVHIPSGVFEVEDGCAGLHYFVVALTIAALFGELQRVSLRTRAAYLALAAALAMFANWVRVFVVVVAGHLTEMQHYLVRVDHYYFGWVLFACTMIAFFWIAHRLPIGAGDEWPSRASADSGSITFKRGVAFAGGAALLAALAPIFAALVPVGSAPLAIAPLHAVVEGWSGPGACPDDWAPVFPSADERQLVEYQRGAHGVCLFVARYRSQRQGKELVAYENSVLGPTATEIVSQGLAKIDGLELNEVRVATADTPDQLIWYTYRVGDKFERRAVLEQLRYGVASILSSPASSVAAFATVCEPDCEAASARLRQFFVDWKVYGASSDGR